MIPILILAAGQSSRMGGRDKLLEDVGGLPLLRKQALMASKTGQPVFVAIGRDDDKREATIADLDLTVLKIADADEGMGATMRGAIAQLPPAPAFMILLGDLVALETTDLTMLQSAYATHPEHLIWRGATEDGKAGHPIIFDDSLRSKFSTLAGDRGGDTIVAAASDQTKLVKLPGNHARLDLDTPQDWADWRATKL
jgi:CTP:molybdopterin cytidylyltransferase MocA